MNTPLIAVIIVITLIVGSTLSIMNKACKSANHAWCAPMSTVHHHSKTQPPARLPTIDTGDGHTSLHWVSGTVRGPHA